MLRLSVSLAAITLVGCDDHLFPATGGGGGGECEATWAGVQTYIADNCETCHGPPATSGGGIVLPDAITDDLNDLSTQAFPQYGGELVVPGDRSASVLWLAVSHEGSVPVMPIGTIEPLEGHECIGTWIDAGAVLD